MNTLTDDIKNKN